MRRTLRIMINGLRLTSWLFAGCLLLSNVGCLTWLGMGAAQSVSEAGEAVRGSTRVTFRCVDGPTGLPVTNCIVSVGYSDEWRLNRLEGAKAHVDADGLATLPVRNANEPWVSASAPYYVFDQAVDLPPGTFDGRRPQLVTLRLRRTHEQPLYGGMYPTTRPESR